MRQPRSITSIKCEARPAWRKFAQARVPVPPALQILGEEFQGLPDTRRRDANGAKAHGRPAD